MVLGSGQRTLCLFFFLGGPSSGLVHHIISYILSLSLSRPQFQILHYSPIALSIIFYQSLSKSRPHIHDFHAYALFVLSVYLYDLPSSLPS